MKPRRIIFLIAFLISGLAFSLGQDILACTLFAAAGSSVQGGGVLVGKTRDLGQGEEQVLIKEIPPVGIAFLGIASRKNGRMTAGVNEKGLVIVNAAASIVPHRSRRHLRLEKIFSRAASVEEALKIFRQEGMQSPIHYLLADPNNLILLEVYSPERFETRRISEGVLVHTNHFFLPGMKNMNGKIPKSSNTRLNRIHSLMQHQPFTISKFISFSQDHENGPGNLSICRHRPPEQKSGWLTVAALVMGLQERTSPEVWFRLGQPCEGDFQKASFPNI